MSSSAFGFQMIRSSNSVRKSPSPSHRPSSTAGGLAAAVAGTTGPFHFFGNQKLRSFNTALQRLQNGNRNIKIDIVKVNDSLLPDIPPLPSNSSDPGAWKIWLTGIIFTVIIPFWHNKWGPLKKWQERVEEVVDTAQKVTEMVEDVAEEVGKVADEIGDSLPQGSSLQQAALLVENLSNQAVKSTDLLEEVLDKVEAVENQVEDFLDEQMDDKKKPKDGKISSTANPGTVV